MDFLTWQTRVHHNIRINTERSHHLRRFREFIREVPVKEQHCFNVHLSELAPYVGRCS